MELYIFVLGGEILQLSEFNNNEFQLYKLEICVFCVLVFKRIVKLEKNIYFYLVNI